MEQQTLPRKHVIRVAAVLILMKGERSEKSINLIFAFVNIVFFFFAGCMTIASV